MRNRRDKWLCWLPYGILSKAPSGLDTTVTLKAGISNTDSSYALETINVLDFAAP